MEMTAKLSRSLFRGALGLLLWSAALAAFADGPATAPPPPVSMLAPFQVKDEAICSFGFSFSCFGDAKTNQIQRLVITDIQQGSRADTIGLTRGDMILEVNGIKVSDLKGGLGRGGDLMRLFVNRPYGEKIRLTVAIKGSYYDVTLPARPSSRPLLP